MQIKTFSDKNTLGARAAEQAAGLLRRAIQGARNGRDGAAQFEFPASTQLPGIDWSKVEMFHLDEYVGIPSLIPPVSGGFCASGSLRKLNHQVSLARWRPRSCGSHPRRGQCS